MLFSDLSHSELLLTNSRFHASWSNHPDDRHDPSRNGVVFFAIPFAHCSLSLLEHGVFAGDDSEKRF